MSNDLKQELDQQLSVLVREYQSRGLSTDEICDSLSWHEELAQVRNTEQSLEHVMAD